MTIDLEKFRYGNQLFSGGTFKEPLDPSFWETTKASVGYTYDPLIEYIYNQAEFPEIDPTYNPIEDVSGYEEFQGSLLYARNKQHMNSLKRGIDENKARRQVLENSSFWSQIGAGIFDPINLVALPLGGPALTVGKTFAKGAIGIGALQTGLETIRYPIDPLATLDESVLNIAFASVTGGLITSAISVPAVRRNKAINNLINNADELENDNLIINNLARMNNKELEIARSELVRKPFKNITDQEIKDEVNLNSKQIYGATQKLKKVDLSPKFLQNLNNKKNQLEIRNNVLHNELSVRRLESTGVEFSDKYKIAAGGWIGNLISTPLKRVLNSDATDFAKKTMLDLVNDSGVLINLNKMGIKIGPSVYQLKMIMHGEWVQIHQKAIKHYGDQIKTDIKTFAGVQLSDATTKIGNRFGKQTKETSDDFFREALRKRTFNEEGATPAEKAFIEDIDKFFKKWELRLEETGQIGSKKNLEELISQGRIKKDRIIEEFKQKKNPSLRHQHDHLARLDMLEAQIIDHEFSLASLVKGKILPKGEKNFLPRYWNKNYVKKNRKEFSEILFDWYSKNPITYEVDANLKWKEINLKTSNAKILERVNKTIDNILDESDSELIPNVGAGKSKHVKHRVLDIPNELVWDFIVQDPIAIMKGYTEKTAGKYQFAKKHNNKTIHEVIFEGVENMNAAGKSGDEIDKWRRDYYAMYQRVVTSPMERSPDTWDNSTAYWLKEAAQLNYLGSAGISAIPDFAKIIMEHDMGDIIKGLQALLTDNQVTLNGKEAKLVGEAIELIQGNSQIRLVEDLTNNVRASQTYDKVKNVFYLANGLAPITHLAKTLDSMIRGHSLIDMSRKLAMPEKYGKATKMEKEYLARYNIDKEMAIEIANAPYEETANGLILPNTRAWENNSYQFPKHGARVIYGNTGLWDKNKIYNPAFYDRKTNTIKFDRQYIEDQFNNKPWTKPIIDGVDALPEDAFESPQAWANFVFMREIMHNKFKPDDLGIPKITKDVPVDFAKLRNEKIIKYKNLKDPVSPEAMYENIINDFAYEQHLSQPRMTEETLTTFRTALQSGILNTVIMGTPADKPIIVDGVAYIPMSVASKFNMPEHKVVKGYARIESGLLGLPFQFYSYSLGALNKITMSALQGQMKNRALGLSLSLGLGMLTVKIKTPDWAFSEMDWDDWFVRGFDQSGIAALYSDFFYTSLQTSLAMGAPNITGGIIKPKFPSNDAYGASIGLGGAGPSIAYDYGSALKELLIDGEYSEGAKNLFRSLPFARMWFWKDQMNEFSNGFKNWF